MKMLKILGACAFVASLTACGSATIPGGGAAGKSPGVLTGIDSFKESITVPAGSRLADGRVLTEDLVFDCGRLDIKRGGGFIAPGYVAAVKHTPVSPTGNLRDLSVVNQGLIQACNQGSELVYVGHTEGALKLGIGYTHLGGKTGGDTVVYGSQAGAVAGSVSGATADANAGAAAGANAVNAAGGGYKK